MDIEVSANPSYHFRLRPEVRRSLARLNISQNELARTIGLTSGFMSQLLTGRRLAGPVTRRRLMGALPLDFDQLFEEVSTMRDASLEMAPRKRRVDTEPTVERMYRPQREAVMAALRVAVGLPRVLPPRGGYDADDDDRQEEDRRDL
jgi:transcriptional regulator with XRE-family HTH domain